MKITVKKPTTIRLYEKTKKWAQSFARSSGIDLSTLISLSLRETKRKWTITVEPQMSDKKFAFYMNYIKQIDEAKVKTKKYDSLEDMKKDYLK